MSATLSTRRRARTTSCSSSSNTAATKLAAFDYRSDVGVHWNSERAWAGTYITGPSSGATHTGSNQQQEGPARETYQVLHSNLYSLQFGADGEHVFKPRSNGNSATTIIPAKSGHRLRWRSGRRVRQLLRAGRVLHQQGQSVRLLRDRADTAAHLDGSYLEASYTVSGASRKYIPTMGAYSGILPDHPVGSGGWGASPRPARAASSAFAKWPIHSGSTGGLSPTSDSCSTTSRPM